MALSNKKALTLKTLTKSNVWDVQENDILRMWEAGARESDFKDSADHYLEIIKTAFSVEEIKVDKPEVIQKYEDRGYKTMTLKTSDSEKRLIAIKKKPIQRVTDLTYENINHISAGKLLEVLERNFGGGWESLSQSIQDIIEHGFDISTTTLPTSMLRRRAACMRRARRRLRGPQNSKGAPGRRLSSPKRRSLAWRRYTPSSTLTPRMRRNAAAGGGRGRGFARDDG